MIDIGLFLAEGYAHATQVVKSHLGLFANKGIAGGLVHLNENVPIVEDAPGFAFALDSRVLGEPDVNIAKVAFISHRSALTDRPSDISALMAKCADMGATLLIHSPFAEAESASAELASRAGLRFANPNLAGALLGFITAEAGYWQCNTHIHSISTVLEIEAIAAKKTAWVSTSVPLHALTAPIFNDPYGYSIAGRLWPALTGPQDQALLLQQVKAGNIDAFTSHSHLFSELLEQDPLTADAGADMFPHLDTLLANVKDMVGLHLWQQLTNTWPAAFIAREI